jgi:hypothetical protein
MTQWGTFGQQIWSTYGQNKEIFGNTVNIILFQTRLKKKKYLTVDPMSAFHLTTEFAHSSYSSYNEVGKIPQAPSYLGAPHHHDLFFMVSTSVSTRALALFGPGALEKKNPSKIWGANPPLAMSILTKLYIETFKGFLMVFDGSLRFVKGFLCRCYLDETSSNFFGIQQSSSGT